MNQDADMLDKVIANEDFIAAVIREDSSCDWELARNLGEYLLRIDPRQSFGFLILIRALRHLGDSEEAARKFTLYRDAVRCDSGASEDYETKLLESEGRALGF